MVRLLLISFTWADVPFSDLYGCEPRMVRVDRQPRLRLLAWVGRLYSAADSSAAAPFLELGELLERLVEARKPGVRLRHLRRGVIADLLVVAEARFSWTTPPNRQETAARTRGSSAPGSSRDGRHAQYALAARRQEDRQLAG
jgi:hypothetical protein